MEVPRLVRLVSADPAMRPEITARLRHIRRSASPDRRQALVALTDIGGWEALDQADQRLVQRLINVKIRCETPEPMALCGSWYAVPTTDQGAVVDALGLYGAVPVTMRLGGAAWHDNTHGYAIDDSLLAYVTPVLDGWTLVFGAPYALDTWDVVDNAMATLSRRFGAAHAYNVFEGCTAWCIAENGQIIRSYNSEAPDEQIGTPHWAESGCVLPHADSDVPPDKEAAHQLDAMVESFVHTYFLGYEPLFDSCHPFETQQRDALPATFLTMIDELSLRYELGPPAGWFPDEAFRKLELFEQVTNELATAVATGQRDRFCDELDLPRCHATTVAERASVNPQKLGRQTRVEGHGLLARSGGDGHPLTALRGTLPI